MPNTFADARAEIIALAEQIGSLTNEAGTSIAEARYVEVPTHRIATVASVDLPYSDEMWGDPSLVRRYGESFDHYRRILTQTRERAVEVIDLADVAEAAAVEIGERLIALADRIEASDKIGVGDHVDLPGAVIPAIVPCRSFEVIAAHGEYLWVVNEGFRDRPICANRYLVTHVGTATTMVANEDAETLEQAIERGAVVEVD